eukprot:5852902-Pleurochrysis_carterae.AAC.1
MHGRGGGGRAAAVYSRRAGECRLRRPRWVVGRIRSARTIVIVRLLPGSHRRCAFVLVAAGAYRQQGGGTKVLSMREGESHRCVAPAVLISSEGERDKHGALC